MHLHTSLQRVRWEDRYYSQLYGKYEDRASSWLAYPSNKDWKQGEIASLQIDMRVVSIPSSNSQQESKEV